MTTKSAMSTATLMIIVLAYALMVSSWPLGSRPTGHVRKRNVVQLCEVLEATINQSCVKFNDYGCFCGYGGVGKHPVDELDRCCMTHDHCYDSLDCHWFSNPHLTVYSVNYTDKIATCLDSPTLWPCSYKACRCDVQFAACLARTTFNDAYKRYSRDRCH